MIKTRQETADIDLSVRVARTRDEVEAMRCAWENMPRHFNADIDYFLTITASRAELIRPHVVLLERAGRPQAMMIGRIAELVLRDRLIPGALRRPIGQVLQIVHGGIVGDLSPAHCAALLDEAEAALRRGEADAIFLSHIDISSPVYRMALARLPFLRRDHFPVPTVIRTAGIPQSYDAFLAARSKNTRRNLRRHAALIPDRFRDQWVLRRFRHSGEVGQLMHDAEHVASKTYHRGMGTGFRAGRETAEVLALAARREWLRAYVLYVCGQPCAFWTGLLYGRTYYTWTTGYDPAYRDHHPGTFLLSEIFKDCCADPNVERVDFGNGDAQYKRSYCDGEHQTASVYMYAPTFRGVGANLVRSASTLTHEGARRALQASHLWSFARRRWRARLERRAA